MSGNSACRCRQTAPIVCMRLRLGLSAVALIGSFGHEGQAGFPHLDLLSAFEAGRFDPLAVDVGAVEAAEVLDEELVAAPDQDGVPPGDGDVVEEDLVVGRAADRGALALGQEVLARASAARAHDYRGTLGRELLEQLCPVL